MDCGIVVSKFELQSHCYVQFLINTLRKVAQSAGIVEYTDFFSACGILTFDPAKNAIQSDAPEGGDTF